jgi:hypothetical protein
MRRLIALLGLALALGAGGPARAETPAGIGVLVRARAAALGDPSPSSAAMTATTYQRARAATFGLPHVQTPLPGRPTTDQPVELVIVTGAFTGLPGFGPGGAAGPTGHVLTMIVDPANIASYDFDLTVGDAMPDVAALGPSEPLDLPATPLAAAPAPAACAAWNTRIARLAARAAALRRGAVHARPASRRKLALATAARLERSRSGYRLLADQLCASPPARPVSILWQDFLGGPPPGIGRRTFGAGAQLDDLAALLPVPLPRPVPDPACGVAGLAAPGRPAPFLAREIEVTLSTGQRLSYPTCHPPGSLALLEAALDYLSNPTGLPPP